MYIYVIIILNTEQDGSERHYFQSPRVRSDFAESFDCFENVIKDARERYNNKFRTFRMLLHAVVFATVYNTRRNVFIIFRNHRNSRPKPSANIFATGRYIIIL